ncbi:MAG: chloride channel protein [Actinobacteria bacterium]|nr:chloride channel protein [Actinomycetota bacterium]
MRRFAFDGRAAELRSLLDRTREVVILAAVIGVVSGLGVAAFDLITADVIFDWLTGLPVWAEALGPPVGLALAAVALRVFAGGAGPATTDEYIRSMTDPEARFALRPVLGRLFASMATLGGGAAMGFEGPSIYLGAGVGAALYHRLGRRLQGIDRRVALVAGAAAGVAAIFKAPATGAVFALEVPYQDDLASNALLPALVGAATGYAAFAAIKGTDPIIPVAGRPPIDARDLIGAAVLGIACGLGARLFAWLLRAAKDVAARLTPWQRVALAGVVLAGLVIASRAAFDGRAFSLGPGYRAVEWALDPGRSLAIVALLATIRVAATTASVAGGGVGGLFVPLVVQGALTGRLIGGLVGGANESLFVVLGIAAFLGAGYRVPLAAVMFVAEATGRPGFVVPGLLAAVVAQLAMGSASVSPYQQRRQLGHVEERAHLPIGSVLVPDTADAVSCQPDETLSRFFATHVATARRRAVAVLGPDGCYQAMVFLDDVLAVDPGQWATTTLGEVMRTDAPVGRSDWTIGEALTAMLAADVDHLPVVADDGTLQGITATADILDLDDLLGRLDHRRDH